ncbi:hypothetical protein Tco_0178148 [Tanacetum coccineum]
MRTLLTDATLPEQQSHHCMPYFMRKVLIQRYKSVSGLKKVKDTYKNVEEYIATFEPLLFEEVKAQIAQSKEADDRVKLKFVVGIVEIKVEDAEKDVHIKNGFNGGYQSCVKPTPWWRRSSNCIRGTVAIQVDWYEVSRSTRGSISLVDPAGDSLEAITPDLPIEEPDNSLSMGDEHLSTIPETESDELIKSSVEILVPIPSLEEVNDDHEEKEFDLEDILQIQDVILRRNCCT